MYLCTNGITLGDSLDKFKPSPYLSLNLHLDEMAETHDRIVGAKGIFKKTTASIRKAKQFGFTVCTNTTIFRDTDPKEIEELYSSYNGFWFYRKLNLGEGIP
ncbi:MAG: hypothetical protein MRK01_09100 [Candidatus Scalindua sp.]|nr:hypothetical protein [Candidatus Scalindua sp.]